MNSTLEDLYDILGAPRTASCVQIKELYRLALLRSHPDKQLRHGNTSYALSTDIHRLKLSYEILSDPTRRAEYDSTLDSRISPDGGRAGPRPAQVISLHDFEESELGDGALTWRYSCRCGAWYEINEGQMDNDQHLIGCNGCSEVVWVGYEVANDDNDNP